MAQEASSSRRLRVIVGAVLVAGILAVWLRLDGTPEEPAAPPGPVAEVPGAPTPGAGESPPRPEPRLVSPREGPVRLQSGETVAIAWQDLTGDAPVQIELVLPAGVAAKSGRLVTPGPASLALDAQVAGQADTIALAVPVERLRTPGRYILELRTDERSALPLRRFAIEVR